MIFHTVDYTVPQPLTTTQESESTQPSTSGSESDDTTKIIVISVVVSVGVVLFTVFMLVGLIIGFRYLFQKLKGEHYLKYYAANTSLIPQVINVFVPI